MSPQTALDAVTSAFVFHGEMKRSVIAALIVLGIITVVAIIEAVRGM